MTLLTAAAITRLTWAKRIESYDQIPATYLSFFENLTWSDSSGFPYIVQTPSYEGFINETKGKLVCIIGHKLYILVKERNELKSTCYDFKDISYIEAGIELLYSWIAISGIDNHGILTFNKFEFNTVSDYLFNPLFLSFRPAPGNCTDTPFAYEKVKFDYLDKLNYKFMNYARRSIRPGQKVIRSILQPEICEEIFSLFGKTFYRTITPAHFIILTDTELITITDVERSKWSKDSGYRSIWHYIPLAKIVSVSQDEKEGGLFSLSILLPENETFVSLLQANKKQEIDSLLEKIPAVRM
jgi:hypothetical protein